MSFDGEESEVFEFFEEGEVDSENISVIEVELVDMFQNRVVGEFKVSIMSVFDGPGRTVFGELAVEHLNFRFGVNILLEFLGLSDWIIVHPEHFQIEVFEFLDDFVNLVFSQLVRHE